MKTLAISFGWWLAMAALPLAPSRAVSQQLRLGQAHPDQQIVGCRFDAVHGKQWVTVRDTTRPWSPPRMERAEDDTATSICGRGVELRTRRAAKMVRAGAPLKVVYETQRLRVTVPGVALQAGSRGEVIRVRVQPMSGTSVVEAEVIDANTALRRR